MKQPILFFTLFLINALMSVGAVEPRLAEIFQDHMVLQQGKPVTVWGWADPGTPVQVAFAGQVVKGTAGENGRWQLALTPLQASAEGAALTVNMGSQSVVREDVVVGEVWIAAGQSNMNHTGPDKPTGLYPHYQSPGTAGGKPSIRFRRFGGGASLEPLEDVAEVSRDSGAWEVVQEPLTDTNLSRYFARILRDELELPIGIVQVAVSGTNQGAWMSRETLEQFPGKDGSNFYEQLLNDHSEKLAKKGKNIKSWEAYKQAEAAWLETREGRYPGRGTTFANFPTALYNSRVHPLAPFAVRGVIWHQGEGGPGGPYGERLVAMAKQWRDLFGQDFAFIWGTLTRSTDHLPPLEPQPTWFYRSGTNISIREAEGLFADDPATTMVEFYDIGDQDTHFYQKAEAGRRMALAAMDRVYGQPQVYSGPLMREVQVNGGKATVVWDRVAEGLRYEPSLEGVSGFYIKGKSGEYRWAKVALDGKDGVILSHPEVAEIAELGYAVNQNPHETLFNSAGFPASPFRWNMGRIPWSGHSKSEWLTFQPGTPQKTGISMTHVRREGVVFQMVKGRKTPDGLRVGLQMKLSPEWKNPAVLLEGEPLKFEVQEQEGTKVALFDVSVDNSWIVVGEGDQVAELNKIRRF
ncbi:sialate O-acetylesterase [Kiritimatiellaeota bacterium B1221]|nr:sialate O-acetylesterase [Kiritimatiellaeota bacterium B1221]